MKKFRWAIVVVLAAPILLCQNLSANGLSSYDSVYDGCLENNDGTDVEDSDIWCGQYYGENICDGYIHFCDAIDPKVKIRIHFDIEEPFWYEENEECFTLDDETIMYRPSLDKWTGPEVFRETWISGNTLYWAVLWDELDLDQGDYVAGWVDIHHKGIQDRVPNTDDTDGCAKPQDYGEALEVVVP